MESFLSKVKSKKFLFLLAGILIVSELIWAGWTLTKPISKSIIKTDNLNLMINQADSDLPGKISLKIEKNQIKINEQFEVSVNISSKRPTGGTDLILTYDPKFLEIILDSKGQPFKIGKLYDDYLLNSIDEKIGKITLSGISSKDQGIAVEGLLGTLSFKAKSAGKTKILIDFKKDSTIDSNIIETKTGKDLLGSVEDLDLNIMP